MHQLHSALEAGASITSPMCLSHNPSCCAVHFSSLGQQRLAYDLAYDLTLLLRALPVHPCQSIPGSKQTPHHIYKVALVATQPDNSCLKYSGHDSHSRKWMLSQTPVPRTFMSHAAFLMLSLCQVDLVYANLPRSNLLWDCLMYS